MSATRALWLVYGGTFDPVHRGHVAVADAAAAATRAERVLLVPCGDPPHRRAPLAPGALRAELLALAFPDRPQFAIDRRELDRAGPSFMVDTLASIRAEAGDAALALVIGMDAARGLPTWHRWRELPALAHLLLVPRPGGDAELPPEVATAWRRLDSAPALRETPAGGRWRLPEALSDASSTRSRAALARGDLADADLPEAVRERLARGSPYGGEGSGPRD